MAFINTRDIVGEQALIDSLLDGSCKTLYTEYKDDAVIKTSQRAFYRWTALVLVDLPSFTGTFDASTFNGCTALSAVILRGNTVATLGSSVFANTPIASGTGYVYVPRAMVDSYKAATNWSNYAAQFRALEDYTIDGTVTGDLDETKI